MKDRSMYMKKRFLFPLPGKLSAILLSVLILAVTLLSGCFAGADALTSEEDVTMEAYGNKLVTWSADGSTVMAEYEDGTLILVEKGESYTGKDEVALYIYGFECLPDNFITKKEAQSLGWSSSKGNLDKAAPGKSIGGDRFGNYEGLLPKEKNRQYYECDINYEGGYRQAERIIYSNDGLVYYTQDHYNSFEQLY